MKPILEQSAGVAVLILRDDALVGRNAGELKGEVEAAMAQTRKVIIDLSNVQFIDSAGCGALLQAHKLLHHAGGGLIVCSITRPVRALFELVRIQRVLDVLPHREEAVQALTA